MLKIKRKTKTAMLSQLRKYAEPKTLMRCVLLALSLASVVVALIGIVYLGTILVISMFVGRIITTSEGLILTGLTILGAGVATHLFVDLALRIEG